jgi:hypothetical protein
VINRISRLAHATLCGIIGHQEELAADTLMKYD